MSKAPETQKTVAERGAGFVQSCGKGESGVLTEEVGGRKEEAWGYEEQGAMEGAGGMPARPPLPGAGADPIIRQQGQPTKVTIGKVPQKGASTSLPGSIA